MVCYLSPNIRVNQTTVDIAETFYKKTCNKQTATSDAERWHPSQKTSKLLDFSFAPNVKLSVSLQSHITAVKTPLFKVTEMDHKV